MPDPHTEASAVPTATRSEPAVEARRARQAAALRANLQRRKQQARERDGAAEVAAAEPQADPPCR